MVFEDMARRALAIGTQSLYNAIKDTVREMHGDYGAAAIAWGLNGTFPWLQLLALPSALPLKGKNCESQSADQIHGHCGYQIIYILC